MSKLWDFTTLDTLERCEEEFVRKFVRHLDSPRRDPSLLFGAAVHAGVSVLHDGKSVGEAQEAATLEWRKEFGVGEAPRGGGGLLVAPGLDLDSNGEPFVPGKKKHITAEYVRAAVGLYAAEALSLRGGRTILNECYLKNEREGHCGIVDRVREEIVGKLAVRDLKTTGLYVSDEWIAQWEQNQQAAGYLDLAEHTLGRGVEEFWVEVIHVDRRGYPKPGDFAAYGPFHYAPGLRAELRAERRQLIARANYLVEFPGDAVKRTRSCIRYNKLCPFFKHGCTAEPAEREARYELAVAMGSLEQREWKPEERAQPVEVA